MTWTRNGDDTVYICDQCKRRLYINTNMAQERNPDVVPFVACKIVAVESGWQLDYEGTGHFCNQCHMRPPYEKDALIAAVRADSGPQSSTRELIIDDA